VEKLWITCAQIIKNLINQALKKIGENKIREKPNKTRTKVDLLGATKENTWLSRGQS
jgi:hypothetical protein